MPLVLASTSPIRTALLSQAGIDHDVLRAPVDEDAIRMALTAEGARPRDMADALAEAKARRASAKRPDALCVGCDQILEFEGVAKGKFTSPEDAKAGLTKMQGQKHFLHSAAVIYEMGTPIWRHVSTVRMYMRSLSERYISDYVDTYWEEIAYCAGGYRVEAEGARLFTRIEGDFFAVQGLPLLEVVAYLALRGDIEA